MDREEIRKTVELLRKIDVEEYGLEFHEVVAAGAVKAYLCGLPRQEALGKLRAIMKGTVLKIPALDEKPELLQTTVKGIGLIKLIDTAVAAQIDTIKSRQRKKDQISGKSLSLHCVPLRENISWKMFLRSFSVY